MADYWKSNDRKFCDFCKCWITDNKPSITFHENGRRHKANVAKKISEISRNSAKMEKEKQKMDQELHKMEEAALKHYALDISSNPDITGRSINAIIPNNTEKSISNISTLSRSCGRVPGAQIDPLSPPEDFDPENEKGPKVTKKVPMPSASTEQESLWVEAKSPEGYTYYWHVKTNESIWEPPKEGYMSLEEYNRINQIAIAQQQLELEKDSKKFQETAAETVARYNRERLKAFRRPDPDEILKEQKRETYKSEQDIQGAPAIGKWVPVVKKEIKHINLELPKQLNYTPQVVSQINPEPPMKKFKEKTLDSSLDPNVTASIPSTFKKRKMAGKGNLRQRLDVD